MARAISAAVHHRTPTRSAAVLQRIRVLGLWCLGPPFWFQFPWLRDTPLSSTALKELFPIVAAAGVWGRYWAGKLILCHSDNAPAVTQVNSLHAQNPLAAHLLKCLTLFQALFDFRLRAVHISGTDSIGADLLSRNQALDFLSTHPGNYPFPSPLFPALIMLLCLQATPATSASWRELFNNFWREKSRKPPGRCMPQAGASTRHLPTHSPSPSTPSPTRR